MVSGKGASNPPLLWLRAVAKRAPAERATRTIGRRGFWLLGIVVLLACTGCEGSARVPVAGRVVFDDGEPVRSGRIEFRGRSPKVRGTGSLDDEGYFSLMGDDGAAGLPPGDYDVVVVQLVMIEKLSLAEHGHGRPLPRRYADYYTSGLQATVPPQGATDLELTVSQ